MRYDLLVRVALALAVMTPLMGCRAFRNHFSSCSTCSASPVSYSEPVVVSDQIVSDGFVSDGFVGVEPGCTTCQKSLSIGDGPVTVESPTLLDDTSLYLPTPESTSSYSVAPEEQPIKPEPAKAEEPKQPVPTEPSPTPPPVTKSSKPGAINVDLRSSMSVAMVGQEVTFDVTLANAGGMSIDEVELSATFSEGLRPKSVTPAGVARIEGQRVIFDQIRQFTPMTLTYRIVAEAISGMPESRLTIEVASPVLTAGPIKKDTVVRITQ